MIDCGETGVLGPRFTRQMVHLLKEKRMGFRGFPTVHSNIVPVVVSILGSAWKCSTDEGVKTSVMFHRYSMKIVIIVIAAMIVI